MTRSQICRIFAALSLSMFAACGSGGGSDASAHDLTGYWQMFLIPTGASEVGPLPVYLSQSGNLIDGISLTGSMSGTSFSVEVDAGPFTMSLAGTAQSADLATGTVTLSGGVNGTGTFRLERFHPTGTMSVSGTLDGNAIDETSSTAVGMRSYSDVGLSTLTGVTLVLANSGVDFQIELDPASLAMGPLSVPNTVGAEVLLRMDTALVSATASSGTVTVTQYDQGGIAGSYSLTTAAGTVTGSFALSFDLESYDP